jgi:nuclear protein localization family protein 4
LASLGIINGTQLYLTNKEASIAAQVLTKVPVPVEPEQPVKKDSNGAASGGAASSSNAPAPSTTAAAPPPATYGTPGDDKLQANPKFETFDKFLKSRRFDTSALPGNATFISSRVSQGGMIKIPPAVSIKQQPFRHVDTLSVMNVPEIEYFIGYWQNDLMEMGMQRVGWMYGYYLEDVNYEEGTRAVLEAIYEPPQEMIGEIAQFKDDPNHAKVEKLAEALGLEMIGWVFTSFPLDHDDQLLSPVEVQRMARLQNEHSTQAHFTKYTLSKFVTCAIRPDPKQGGGPALNPFMVSDQACAMQRGGIFGDDPDRKHVVVRESQKNELIPDFIVEGKPNKKILTDFFVVRINDSTFKKLRSMFTHADFPRENRQTQPQRRDDLKKYFRKRDNKEPSWSRFADFHLLVYIAQEIDIDTAVAIADCVRDRKQVPEGMVDLFKQLTQG